MTTVNQALTKRRTTAQENALAVLCLLAGIAAGWMIRGPQGSANSGSAAVANAPAPSQTAASPSAPMPDSAQWKEMADAKVAPMLDQLKANPTNPDLLTGIGNVYYDARQYSTAIDYYRRALKGKPADAAVRTDMATAYWYMGDADTAIAEFNQALTYAPKNPNTLFNLGVARWKGKNDSAGAIADWEKLLAANPNYEGKDRVIQMIAEAKNKGR